MSRRPSPWRVAGEAMRLRAWRDSDRAELAGVLRAALLGWCEAWGLACETSAVRCGPLADAPHRRSWQRLGGGDAAAAWISAGAEFEHRLANALWGEVGAQRAIAHAVARRCGEDLQSRLRSGLQVGAAPGCPDEAPPGHRAWSGALQATLPWGMALWLEADAVANVLRSRAPSPDHAPVLPVVDLLEAVAPQRLPLRVHLADVELDLGDVQGLRVGDVVRVNHALHAPLEVREAQGRVLFNGSLARCGGRKAVALEPLARAGSSGGV